MSAAGMNTGSYALRTEGLAIGYRDRMVVRDITMAVQPGRIVSFIGPNGAGKSTLLKTLAGELPSTAGAVYLQGKPLDGLTEREQSLERAVLLTERLRTELLTCFDVVAMGRYPHTGRFGVLQPNDRAAIRGAMELMRIQDLADEDFMHLSDGQRQRVLLARAICQEPAVLMLDEPTSYLDIRHQIELLGVLRTLASTHNLCVVMSMHELSLARQASDWLVCLKDGAVVAQGVPADIFVPEVIDELYDLEPGSYDAVTGQIRLARVERGA